MKRVILLITLAAFSSACTLRWVGKPVTKLEKAYGSPLSVQPRGDGSVYYYPDYLAGRGQMTFIIDKNGIIRSWCATNDVPSVFGSDPFGTGDGGFGPVAINDNNGPFGTNNPNSTNGPVSLGNARAGRNGNPAPGARGGPAPNCR